LSPEPPAAPCAAAPRSESRRHLRRNQLVLLGHGLLGQTGMRLINAPTLIPAYVAGLAGFDAAVGIARALQYLGTFLSPLPAAVWLEPRRRVLPTFLLSGALMRIQILALALAGLWLPGPWALAGACISLALFGFFQGIQGVVSSVLTAKILPVESRGLVLGVRNGLAGTFVFGVSLYAGSGLVEAGALGNGYAATFLLAFALTSCGLAVMVLVREPDSAGLGEPGNPLRRLREVPGLLRAERPFALYFAARALATLGRMGVPFYVLYAQTRLPLGGQRLGLLTAVFVLTQSAGDLVWGILADRRGFRAVLIAALCTWISAALVLMGTRDFATLLAVFAALGAGLGGFQLGVENLVLEFGADRDLPMRVAVSNAAGSLAAALGSLAGGLLASALSYLPVFWIATGFQLVALALLVVAVDEPRRRPGGGKRRRPGRHVAQGATGGVADPGATEGVRSSG